ncbi:BRCA1-associated RING domain protein 1 isoform X2 [Andrographis paniculata]|uniref:BRCA1-associated RING domain protein 1 isoform X2 n=1 Tax=Andrographis paniculata TaxID=175694 RepID=UPI0021E89DBB|nr:BRCA1-associated RING domain protein 1 isoform X2 [Andrographis paniculata]
MSNARNAARLLNPCVFHLQKLGIELKCPSCLNLLNKPMLLPCNHILCDSCVPKSSKRSTPCPACLQHFTDREIRSASYLENVVGIYKSLDTTFNATILPLLSTCTGTWMSMSTSPHQLWKPSNEMAIGGKNNHVDASPVSGAKFNKSPQFEELDVKHASETSPGSSPSVADTAIAGHSDPDTGNRSTEKQGAVKSAGGNSAHTAVEVDDSSTFNTREPKRQKKLSYGPSNVVLQSHECKPQLVLHSDEAAVSCEEYRHKEDVSTASKLIPCDASYPDGNVCAFCCSSKTTEETGQLLHYANGKAVTQDEIAFSTAIPVHIKCIEWTPQVYFSGEMIMNLESELARASKLKCSSCGLKGAALGCFAKSCRRTYHMPCAMEIAGCRWDCEDFLMLCPSHKSIKFPSEKSKSRNHHNGEKCSLSTQGASIQPSFWASSPNGRCNWVFCGSALSPQDKSVMIKFAKLCGATVFKSWNRHVTHVIAATDSNGACSRTLKVLMAILNGRWVLTMDWIKACIEAHAPVDEEPYEVNMDNHGLRDGPKLGRLRSSNNAPKLFEGMGFYFNGDFIPSFKNDLLNLVTDGGGTVIENMEKIMTEELDSPMATTFVVYNYDSSQGSLPEASSFASMGLAEAERIARNFDAVVIPHTWILESIASCSVLAPHLP